MGRVESTRAVTGREVGYTLDCSERIQLISLKHCLKNCKTIKNIHSTICQKQNDGAINVVELYVCHVPSTASV